MAKIDFALKNRTKPATVPQPPKGLTLRFGGSEDGFTTLDLIDGLQGVCAALDASAMYRDKLDHTHQLAMAAKALSAMLAGRLPS
jgi:hypothetical protein